MEELFNVVIVHLFGIILAVQYGLTSADIINRVGGHFGWFTFYSTFVLAAAIHAPIGLRTVLVEMTTFSKPVSNLSSIVFRFTLLILGLRATWGFLQLGVPT